MKRIILVIVLLAAIGGGIYYATLGKPHEIVLTGIVTTDSVIVSSQVLGRLQKLNVKQGDSVKQGDLIAVIQPDQWKADVNIAQSTQQQAATQVSQAESDLRFMEDQTKSQIAQAQANLASADAQVSMAQSDLENARLTFTREETMFKNGIESAQAFDQARTAYAAAQAKVESMQKQAQSAQAAIGVAQSNLQQVESRRIAIESDRHQLETAAAQKDKANIQLGYTEIHAPIAGVVDIRAALEGEIVNPGQAIITLVNPDDLWVRADVEEGTITSIHLGDKLPVRLPSGVQIDGTVFYRAVDADYATQRDVSRTKRDIKTFEVRLRCDNTDRKLALGMTASVVLPLQTAAGK